MRVGNAYGIHALCVCYVELSCINFMYVGLEYVDLISAAVFFHSIFNLTRGLEKLLEPIDD